MSNHKIKRYLVYSLVCLVLTYASLFSILWLNLSLSIGLVILFTVVGLGITFRLMRLLNDMKIYSIHQLSEYVQTNQFPATTAEHHTNSLAYGFAGLIIGLLIVGVILYFVLI